MELLAKSETETLLVEILMILDIFQSVKNSKKNLMKVLDVKMNDFYNLKDKDGSLLKIQHYLRMIREDYFLDEKIPENSPLRKHSPLKQNLISNNSEERKNVGELNFNNNIEQTKNKIDSIQESRNLIYQKFLL